MGNLSGIGQSLLPSKWTVAAAGTAVASGYAFSTAASALLVLPGMAISASTAGFAIAGAVYLGAKSAGKAISFIRNGAGTVYFRTSELFAATSRRACNAIYVVATTIPAWIISKAEQSQSVKAAHQDADRAYLEQCKRASKAGKSMNICRLFTPTPNGTASQQNVIDALAAHAIATHQDVSQKDIHKWVALGERVVVALTDGSASAAPDGAVIVKSAGGTDIYVESSVYVNRALMWYFTAQALHGELAKQRVLSAGHFAPTAAEQQAMVSDFVAHKAFVSLDPNSKIFVFMRHARTVATDNVTLLAQDSALQGANDAVQHRRHTIEAFTIDDTSRRLPGGARRIVINPLLPAAAGEERRLAVKLEEWSNSPVLGQRGEGHESLRWRAVQAVTGLSAGVMHAASGLAAPDLTTLKTRTQVLHHVLCNEAFKQLEEIGKGDATWAANREQVYQALQQLPLHEILNYLVHPMYRTVLSDKDNRPLHNSHLRLLHDIPASARDNLKKMVYSALIDGIQAESVQQMQRRENETMLMPPLRSAIDDTREGSIYHYWRTQVGRFQTVLLDKVFLSHQAAAEQRAKEEGVLNTFVRYAARGDINALNMSRAHEAVLYQQAYQDRLERVIVAERGEEILARHTALAETAKEQKAAAEILARLGKLAATDQAKAVSLSTAPSSGILASFIQLLKKALKVVVH